MLKKEIQKTGFYALDRGLGLFFLYVIPRKEKWREDGVRNYLPSLDLERESSSTMKFVIRWDPRGNGGRVIVFWVYVIDIFFSFAFSFFLLSSLLCLLSYLLNLDGKGISIFDSYAKRRAVTLCEKQIRGIGDWGVT